MSDLSDILSNIDLNKLEENTSNITSNNEIIYNNYHKSNNYDYYDNEIENSYSSDFLNSRLGRIDDYGNSMSQIDKHAKYEKNDPIVNRLDLNGLKGKENKDQSNKKHVIEFTKNYKESIDNDYNKILNNNTSSRTRNFILMNIQNSHKSGTNVNNNSNNRISESLSPSNFVRITSSSPSNKKLLNAGNNKSPPNKKTINNFSTPPTTKQFSGNNCNSASISSAKKKIKDIDIITKIKPVLNVNVIYKNNDASFISNYTEFLNTDEVILIFLNLQ